MGFTVKHPLYAEFADGLNFLYYLVDEYPSLLSEWNQKYDQQCRENAKFEAEGDYEVEYSIYDESMKATEDDEFKKEIFYRSVFLMCFAHLDSCLHKLMDETNKNQEESLQNKKRSPQKSKGSKVDYIIRLKRIELDSETSQKKKNIADFQQIRNDITHNNYGNAGISEERNSILLDIQEKYKGVRVENHSIYITDARLIKDLISDMRSVMKVLYDSCGYKTKKI